MLTNTENRPLCSLLRSFKTGDGSLSCYGTDSEGTDYKSYSHYYYEYDGNGNITAEYGKNRTLRYKYYYDSLNQLVRVNDAVAQKTYTYVYDTA